MSDKTLEQTEQITQIAKKGIQKIGSKIGKTAGRFLLKLLAPYLPVIIGAVIVIILVFAATSVIYAQLTSDHNDIQTVEGTNADQYIEQAVAKANAREQHDAYGRDASLELTKGQVWAILTFANSAASKKISEQEIDKIAEDLKPYFKYQTVERIIEQLKPVTDPETGEVVKNEDGSEKKEWVVISKDYEDVLISADTIIGNYTYTYKKVTETSGDTRITYMQPYETKQNGEPYSRLKKYLLDNFKLSDSDIDIAVQAVLEASAGFETNQDRMAWLMGYGGGYTGGMNYIGIPADIIPAIQEASKMFNIPEWLIAAVIKVESNFNPLARNPTTGAYGLMQIMPFHIDGGLFERLGFDRVADRDNPRAQVIAGTYLLKMHIGNITVDWLTDLWKQQTLKGLANYGGYADDRLDEAEAKYVSKIWAAADMYKSTGVNTGMIWPVPGYTRISSYFGSRTDPITGKPAYHSGIDIPAPAGTQVLSASSGTVIYAGWNDDYGNLVVIESGMYNILYGHNSKLLVSEGQTVQQGQPIALSGNTGRSTGPHLHFGISVGRWTCGRWLDPLSQVLPR